MAVAILQKALADYGFRMRSTRPDGSTDGAFGSETEQAVKSVQQRNGLDSASVARLLDTWPAIQAILRPVDSLAKTLGS